MGNRDGRNVYFQTFTLAVSGGGIRRGFDRR